jgi:DNA-binding transcriptional regulator YiaG
LALLHADLLELVRIGCHNEKREAPMKSRVANPSKPRAREKPKKLGRPLPEPSGGPLVAEVRRKLGLSRKVFSRLTGFSERAIASWESGATPDEPGLRRIRETERFQLRLAEVVKREAIPLWLDTPNDAFAGLKPLEVIEHGEIDRLWNMIFYLESGIAS